MEVSTALGLVNDLVYKPDWVISAELKERFENCIKVRFDYPARNSDGFLDGYPEELLANATFSVVVGDCDVTELYRRILERIMQIEEHEAREFLRVLPSFNAPFHPHQIDGMTRWGDLKGDLSFGIA